MNVLIACEESQEVCKAFREKGHEAFSCDIQDQSGGRPEWHIKNDVLPLLNGKCDFITMDGVHHVINTRWDMIIAHPPCTYLSVVGNRWFSLRSNTEQEVYKRLERRYEAAEFFMKFYKADCDHIAIENPRGYMSTYFRKPDQYIDPYQFAEGPEDTENWYAKKTGLWLWGLPPLIPYNSVEWDYTGFGKYSSGKNKTWEDHEKRSAKSRSKTPPGIARAMAKQWGVL